VRHRGCVDDAEANSGVDSRAAPRDGYGVVPTIAPLALSGCAATQSAVQFARGVFDPGVPGPKPITAEAAAQLGDEQIAARVAFIGQRGGDASRTGAAASACCDSWRPAAPAAKSPPGRAPFTGR
jgi:hypothetical protein